MVAASVGTPLVTTVVGGVVVVSTTEVDEGCVVAGGSRLPVQVKSYTKLALA